MRYHVKGGIWKNTEDEILKAAIMKYGLNQWSRISSLLVRKSAKQCKERWYEWLDPAIKKTEWTKDEEEKLLQLAKAFPCQWRTIAPIIGRTAYQCMEQYEKLLDRAQGREPDENDPRRLRPGEIDPNPETKPARPDPIDMDEDEKEMLNEARARLANTRGKKAKRKAREKQLEEARRLAALQKKRELKSAGIDVVLRLPRKKKKEMNYNIDVPFMRKPKDGTWKVTAEETPEIDEVKGAISLQYLENRTRDEEEEKQRKIDTKRMRNLKQKNLPEAIDIINKMNDPTNVSLIFNLQILQRKQLILPEPQVTEKDLEGISKLTSRGSRFSESTIQESNASKVLVGEYSQREVVPLSMIRTPQVEDHILKEARIVANVMESSTPLQGGEESAKDLENYLNYKKTEKKEFKAPVPITPNLFAQNLSNNTQMTDLRGNNTRATNQSQNSTPFRDEMRINLENTANWENSSIRTESSFDKPVSIKSLLSNLPKPQNNYEIDLTDNLEALKQQDNEEDIEMKAVEDSEEREKRMQMEKLAILSKEERLRSKVIIRNLPRPFDINNTYISYSQERLYDSNDYDISKQEAEELVRVEMLRLLNKDSIDYPIKGAKTALPDDMDVDDNYDIPDQNKAEALISEEFKKIKKAEVNKEEFSKSWDDINKEVFYIPDVQKYCHLSEIEPSQRFDSYSELFQFRESLLTKEENIAKKLEEKAALLTNGYLKRYTNMVKEYSDLNNSINSLKIKNKIYIQMKEQEDKAIIKRESECEILVAKLKERESELQKTYKKYSEIINELEK
jgi:pre-mRNA-splicing factor CDC5/CEF1